MAKQITKILPNSLEAEQGLIASILRDPNIMTSVAPKIDVDDFYSLSHKTIYNAMRKVYNKAINLDFIVVVHTLEEENKLEEVGGVDYLSQITNSLPSASNYKTYIEIIKSLSSRRKLIYASQEIAEKCFENEDSAADINFAEKAIFNISQSDHTTSLEHIDSSLNVVMDKFDQIAQSGGLARGVPTGFADLDALTNGLQKSDLILLAARPGVGKTSLAMNIVNNAAINHGKTCAVFSLEMSTDQIAQRSLCSTACVNMAKALNGQLNDEEWQKLYVAKQELSNAKIFIDAGKNTPEDILSKCRTLKLKQGLDLIMIDYLQFIDSGSNKFNPQQSRTLEIAEITKYFKMTAKELNVPVLLLSQLSRQVDQRPDHRPVLSDLRDSGAIEQDADIVMFIYNPAKYHEIVQEASEQGLVDLEVAKHRNGSPGIIKLRWIGEWTRFMDKDAKVENVAPSKPQDINKISEIAESEELKEIFANDNPPPAYETMENLPPDDVF